MLDRRANSVLKDRVEVRKTSAARLWHWIPETETVAIGLLSCLTCSRFSNHLVRLSDDLEPKIDPFWTPMNVIESFGPRTKRGAPKLAFFELLVLSAANEGRKHTHSDRLNPLSCLSFLWCNWLANPFRDYHGRKLGASVETSLAGSSKGSFKRSNLILFGKLCPWFGYNASVMTIMKHL